MGLTWRWATAEADADLRCVDCNRPITYIEPTNRYERLIRMRQVNHRLCENCARVTAEVGEDMDGLRRKKRFILY